MSKVVLLEFIDEFTEFQDFVKKNNLDINNRTGRDNRTDNISGSRPTGGNY